MLVSIAQHGEQLHNTYQEVQYDYGPTQEAGSPTQQVWGAALSGVAFTIWGQSDAGQLQLLRALCNGAIIGEAQSISWKQLFCGESVVLDLKDCLYLLLCSPYSLGFPGNCRVLADRGLASMGGGQYSKVIP
eukprot:TRINITY_DN4384_c0_g1_i7.p5 TRINITY_DN4384_c0_g1~~TRINITY_DN4384_c0_g1_i7.p5  ORF type:complete len:132 (-),score=8.21 TRINITY_DN4384_c0_g1_i7:148-543(-)